MFDLLYTVLLIQLNTSRVITDPIIKNRCDKTQELCILLDYIFLLARTPSGKTTTYILDRIDQFVSAVVRKWRGLGLSLNGPK